MSEKRKGKNAVVLTAVLIIAVLVIGYVIKAHRDNTAVLEASDIEKTSKTSQTKSRVVVQVEGAVNKPGVYELTGDIRGIDAVNAAGGLRQDADTAMLNLAAKVQDGAKLTVPAKGEQAEQTTSQGNGQVVNINTASKEELMQLSGIGEVIAQNIIDYRTKNGQFTSTEEIKEVNRIGDKLYERIKDQIGV